VSDFVGWSPSSGQPYYLTKTCRQSFNLHDVGLYTRKNPFDSPRLPIQTPYLRGIVQRSRNLFHWQLRTTRVSLRSGWWWRRRRSAVRRQATNRVPQGAVIGQEKITCSCMDASTLPGRALSTAKLFGDGQATLTGRSGGDVSPGLFTFTGASHSTQQSRKRQTHVYHVGRFMPPSQSLPLETLVWAGNTPGSN
jgi:hypothetical protein